MTNGTMLATDRLLSPQLSITSGERISVAHAPYGSSLVSQGTPLTGFTGQLREVGLGFYLLGNGHRVYSPVLMRFLSSDVMSPFSKGGLNSYTYCEGDPINKVDRTGNIPNYVVTAFGNTPALATLAINGLKSYMLNERPSVRDWVVDGVSGVIAAAGMTAAGAQWHASYSSEDGTGQSAMANNWADYTTVANGFFGTVAVVGVGVWVIQKGGVARIKNILDSSPPPSPKLDMVVPGRKSDLQAANEKLDKVIGRRQSHMQTFSKDTAGQPLMGNSHLNGMEIIRSE